MFNATHVRYQTLLVATTEIAMLLRVFDRRGWLVAAAGAVAALVLIGIPADLIHSPWFERQIAAGTTDYVLWVATAVLTGLVIGTFVLQAAAASDQRMVVSGGLLSFLAVGCPICNKLVVLLLGTSGALTFFAPIQPYIGLASLMLLAWTLRLRAKSLVGTCDTFPAPR